MKLRFDATSLDLGHRVVPMAEVSGFTIETDPRKGWLVRALVILAVVLGVAGLVKVFGTDQPGWKFLALCGMLFALAAKSWQLVAAVSDQEKFHTLWAHLPDGKVRLLSVGDLAFAEQVRAAIHRVREQGGDASWEVDPARCSIEELPAAAARADGHET